MHRRKEFQDVRLPQPLALCIHDPQFPVPCEPSSEPPALGECRRLVIASLRPAQAGPWWAGADEVVLGQRNDPLVDQLIANSEGGKRSREPNALGGPDPLRSGGSIRAIE